jgi:hypothetical protein
MDGFLGQFLVQVWPLVVFILGMLAFYVGLLVWMRQRHKASQSQQKSAIQSDFGEPEKKAKPKAPKESAPQWVSSILDEYDDPLTSGSLDELLAPSMDNEYEQFMSSDMGDEYDDPLAELNQAHGEAQNEAMIEEDDEIVQLATLLAGLGEEKVEIVYHHVAENPIWVKLEDGSTTHAQEHISILRDERDERLLVQLGETAYRTLLNDKQAKSSFTTIMKEVSASILTSDDNQDLETIATSNEDYHQVMSEPVHVKLEGGAETTALELLSILRDERDSRPMVQISDMAYRSLANDKQAKNVFVQTMKELSTIILKADENPPVQAQPKTQAPSIKRPLPEAVKKTIEQAQGNYDENHIPGVINIPKMDDLPPTHSVGRFGQVKVNKPIEPVPELNIAEAIESYLQYKIEQTPQFQRRGIHVQSALSGGVRIMVDGKSYDFVDEVEDTQARAFIQQAINEWQDQH